MVDFSNPFSDHPAPQTVILLCWPQNRANGNPANIFFYYPEIIQGERLHRIVDTLISEHVPLIEFENLTEITLLWQHADGTTDMEDFVSHFYVNT